MDKVQQSRLLQTLSDQAVSAVRCQNFCFRGAFLWVVALGPLAGGLAMTLGASGGMGALIWLGGTAALWFMGWFKSFDIDKLVSKRARLEEEFKNL